MEAKDKEQGLTQTELKRRFSYDPQTGNFVYLVDPNRNMKGSVGKVAGTLRNGAYLVITIKGYSYYAHRLVWLYVFGTWPKNFLDHVNGDKTDNRLENLREATYAENQYNTGAKATNTVRLKGVTVCGNRWKAQITKNRKVYYLGLFDTKEAAYAAYCKAAQDMQDGFSPSAVSEVNESAQRIVRGETPPTEYGLRRDNVTGLRGVSPLGNKFRAQMYVKGKAVHLGVYDTKEQAHEAYVKAVQAARPAFARPS